PGTVAGIERTRMATSLLGRFTPPKRALGPRLLLGPIFVAVLLVVLLCLAGCNQVRDFTADLIGAPKPAEVKAAQGKATDAQAQLDQLRGQLDKAQAAQQTAQAAEAERRAKAEMVRGQMSAV